MTDESRAGSSMLHRMLLPVVLALTFVAYSGTLGYEFVYDDADVIVNNRHLTSWSYLPRYFTQHLWSHQGINQAGVYYRPLFLIWLRINRSLFGLNAMLWHLTTLLAYLAAVTMVYWLARRLFKDRMTAVMAAMVFGLCPLHIETAAWVCGGSESLLALLFIPSFLFYLNSRNGAQSDGSNRSARIRWMAASLVLYAAALFSKETGIILPIMIVAYELICGNNQTVLETAEPDSVASRSKAFLANALKASARIVPFLAVTLVYLVIRMMVLGSIINPPTRLPFMTKLLTLPSLLWGYLKLLVWPVGLSEFYDMPYVANPGFKSFFLPLAIIVLAASALWWAIRRIKERRERRILVFACAWMVIPILPVLNIDNFRAGDLIHDRYLFLPTIGFSMLVACGLRKINVGEGRLAGLPSVQALAAMVLAGALGLATSYQHIYWANDIVLFHHSLSVAPGNEIAQNAFGDALSKREMYDEAITVLENLVERHPGNAGGQYNLGYNYYKVGKYKEAVPHLARAIDISPRDDRHYLTLGVTLFYLDKYEVAERVLRDGISLRSDGLGLHYALGAVFKQTGRLQEALDEFKQEVAYNPDYVSAYDQIEQIKRQMQAGPVEPRSN
jgi:tetratricopeptide (TPR) repeat protein